MISALHTMIVGYAGIGVTIDPKVPWTSNVGNVQLQQLFQRCFDIKNYGDEVIMQLVRYSSEVLEVDSLQVINIWKLMAVLVGFYKPTIHEVQEIAMTHFKRMSVYDPRVPSNMVRKEEAEYAVYCYKTLSRTMSSQPRKSIPSAEEIQFVGVFFYYVYIVMILETPTSACEIFHT